MIELSAFHQRAWDATDQGLEKLRLRFDSWYDGGKDWRNSREGLVAHAELCAEARRLGDLRLRILRNQQDFDRLNARFG